MAELSSSEEEEVPKDEYERVVRDQQRIKKLLKEFQIRKAKRSNIFLHVLLCFLCQVVLIIMIFNYLISDATQRAAFLTNVGVVILFARFICGTILHLSLIDEVCTALDNMKFSLNHPYMFQSYQQAWTAGFL